VLVLLGVAFRFTVANLSLLLQECIGVPARKLRQNVLYLLVLLVSIVYWYVQYIWCMQGFTHRDIPELRIQYSTTISGDGKIHLTSFRLSGASNNFYYDIFWRCKGLAGVHSIFGSYSAPYKSYWYHPHKPYSLSTLNNVEKWRAKERENPLFEIYSYCRDKPGHIYLTSFAKTALISSKYTIAL
jgi:hypothetical protein